MTEDVIFEGIDYSVPTVYSDNAIFSFDRGNPTEFTGNTPSTQPLADPGNNAFSGELIDLGGVFEALPPFEIMEDLNRLFFERQQQFAPIIHPARYLQAFHSAPHMKPPMCLQYAIWALCSNSDPKYHACHDVFYHRARQYAESDEMKGYVMFTRAAMSSARAVRLSAMMGLHKLDSPPDESSPTLAPPKDWAELEERRRVFWGIFCIDSHASISTGWPHLIDISEVTTHLPASETAFHSGEPIETCTIHDALKGHTYSSFAGNVIICHLFNQILKHAHRSKPDDNPENYEYGEYWKRHRDIDNTLSSAFMFLPESFRLPENYRDSTAIHLNLNLHASVICLHHAAIERIEAYNLSQTSKKASQDRLSAAAQEIVNIVKLTSHMNAGPRTPLAALSLYCAASVYIYFCKESQTPSSVNNLDFILSAMEAIGRIHTITRSFLRQALLDIERNGIQSSVQLPRVDRLSENLDSVMPHQIPLLARSRVSRHSKAQPPLPGRLPLGNPIGKIIPNDAHLPSTTYIGPIQDSNSPSFVGSGSNVNVHKRKRTGTSKSTSDRNIGSNDSLWTTNDFQDTSSMNPSSHSSLQDNSSAAARPPVPFCYLPIRTESPSQYDAQSPNFKVNSEAKPPLPKRDAANNANNVNNSQNSVGVTIAPGLLGNMGPKPFTTAGRAPSQTRVPKGGMGSWDLAAVCVSAMAEQGPDTALNIENIPFQFVDPGDININWDSFNATLGAGSSVAENTVGGQEYGTGGSGDVG
ncbi:hypothetical protein F5Y19DRAFT_409241 [Xylariaceae sp. FL1651]|nr:hypothetical protein F5Y19DRAFT_409241 [Xylariaceae sp. FL1651]